MNNRFAADELRRAITALAVIEEHGNRDEWAYILRQAQDSAPSVERWGNATGNQQIGGSLLAARLADLLGESRDRCELAAAEVFAPQRHRAVFDAIIFYAEELTGASSRRKPPATSAPIQRPAVRIVGDQEAPS
jgi:hypothetical protein